MKCPKDHSNLERQTRGEIEVNFCPTCEGMWLDLEELDQLEDLAYDEDEFKGTLVFSDHTVDHPCPQCGTPLRQFKYRLYDLVLEYCPNQHGFWLDAYEDHRVLELMAQRSKDLKRKMKAEAEWSKMMKRFRSRSFWEKLKDLFP